MPSTSPKAEAEALEAAVGLLLEEAADFPAAALVEARAKNKHQKLSQKIITKNIRFKI